MIALGSVPDRDTALTSAGDRLFWILIIFGVVLLVGSAGRGRPTRAIIRVAALRRERPGRPAYDEIDPNECSGHPRSDGLDARARRPGVDVDAGAAYGLWPLVMFNTALFALFAASFFHPRTGRDWRAMGAFTAFLVALFTEMYGVPLTVYLLSGWLGSKIPGLRATHSGGHLFNDLIGWTGDPHLSPFHLASYVFIGGGFWLIAAAWRVLHDAAQHDRLATTGPYAQVRHPQYDGLLLIMVGFLFQWPTIATLVMFPILVFVYTRLARAEEREVAARFGAAWRDYAAATPAFVPRRRHGEPSAPATRPDSSTAAGRRIR